MKYSTKISGYWEKTYPYVLGIIAACALYKFEPSISEKRMDALLSASINVSAILMGFLGTSKAMLLSFRSAKTHWLSKNPGGWSLLLSYFRHAITLSLLVCVLSFLLTALELENKHIEISFYIFLFWASTLIATLAAFYRVLGIFFKLLK
jgi:hypothetical protein